MLFCHVHFLIFNIYIQPGWKESRHTNIYWYYYVYLVFSSSFHISRSNITHVVHIVRLTWATWFPGDTQTLSMFPASRLLGSRHITSQPHTIYFLFYIVHTHSTCYSFQQWIYISWFDNATIKKDFFFPTIKQKPFVSWAPFFFFFWFLWLCHTQFIIYPSLLYYKWSQD